MQGKRIRYASIVAIGAIGLVAAPAVAKSKPAPAKTVTVAAFPVSDVIAEIKTELAAAESTPGASTGITLQKVAVNFALTQTLDANGNATISIPVVGGLDVGGSGGRKSEQTSTLAIELAPPKGAGPAMSGQETKDFGLTQAIVATRNELIKGLNQKPLLVPEKVVITLKFALTKTTGGTAKFKFLIFSIGGGLTSTGLNTSTIELTFTKASAP